MYFMYKECGKNFVDHQDFFIQFFLIWNTSIVDLNIVTTIKQSFPSHMNHLQMSSISVFLQYHI